MSCHTPDFFVQKLSYIDILVNSPKKFDRDTTGIRSAQNTVNRLRETAKDALRGWEDESRRNDLLCQKVERLEELVSAITKAVDEYHANRGVPRTRHRQ